MPFTKVYIHFVWSTKNRTPFLETLKIRKQMWRHIKENAQEKGIHIDTVNGYDDHCHCLVSLGREQTISKVVQLIKGESAFWFNNQKLILDKFEWQNDYFAVSVSESVVEKVRTYIKNQEMHHNKKTFQDEYNEMMDKFGFLNYED